MATQGDSTASSHSGPRRVFRKRAWLAGLVAVILQAGAGTGAVAGAGAPDSPPRAMPGGLDVPLTHWAAPAFWRPEAPVSAATARGAGAGLEGGSIPVVVPLQYVAITPCRLIDTRGLTSPNPPYPMPTGYGSDNPLLTGATADYQVTGASHCVVPAGAKAVSANVTVLGYTADGYLTAYPADAAQPIVATLNWRTAVPLAAGQFSQNAGVVDLSAAGMMRVYALQFAKMVVDVNGYYMNTNQTVEVGGSIPSIPGGATGWVFTGPTTLLAVAANQRITGHGAGTFSPAYPNVTIVGFSLCYQSGAGAITDLSDGNNQAAILGYPGASIPASASKVMTAAGSYTVGYCVWNSGGNALSSNAQVNTVFQVHY